MTPSGMTAPSKHVQHAAPAAHLSHLQNDIATQRAAHADVALYLLVDRAMAPKVRQFASRALAGFPHEVLFMGTSEADYADDFSPWLVALPNELVNLWARGDKLQVAENLCQLAHDHACVSWLWSRLELSALAVHLRTYLSGVLWNEHEDAEEGEVFLRYFDARVLPAFIGVLSEEQRGHFLRPVQCWALWDRTLAWNVWTGASATSQEAVPAAQLRYTLAQQAALAIHSQPDRLLSQLAEAHPPTESGRRDVWGQLLVLPPDARYRRMRHLIEVGRQLGLSDDRDLILHAVIACCTHPRYERHPQIAAAFRECLATGGAFSKLVAGVDDALWDELASRPLEAAWPEDAAGSSSKWTIDQIRSDAACPVGNP